jgi:uncharacterized membrane protein
MPIRWSISQPQTDEHRVWVQCSHLTVSVSLWVLTLAFMASLGVVSAWGVLNVSYALHYAYLYYRAEESPGGLAFPGEQSPKQRDFAYFAFTVGTSFAVSDVDVTEDGMRQAVLGQQILSFFYNTSILATVISMATG